MSSSTPNPIIHASLSVAANVASLSAIPLLPVAFQLAGQIVTLCENVKTNKEAIRQLQQYCKVLLRIMQNVDQSKEKLVMQQAIQDLVKSLQDVHNEIKVLAGYKRIMSFILQGKVTSIIGTCTIELERHIRFFEISSHNDIRANVNLIGENLADLQNTLGEKERAHEDLVMLQSDLHNHPVGSLEHKIAARMLYNVQVKSRLLLPDIELQAGAVRRLGTQAIGGNATIDLWDGLYLEETRCTLKNIRASQFSEKEKRRFLNEVEIWRKIYDTDQGKHAVPLLGVCFFEESRPYLVSPYYKNGDALVYVRTNPDVNRLRLIKEITSGLIFLHNQQPPIAHGNLMASKIVISDDCYPLIADFGLAKVIEHATGEQFTRTDVGEQGYRWLAPEICFGDNVVTTAADVFSFARTILEIMTGLKPFPYIKRIPDVVVEINAGRNPRRPSSDEAILHGLNDGLWNLMELCWAPNREHRPTIVQVSETLRDLVGE